MKLSQFHGNIASQRNIHSMNLKIATDEVTITEDIQEVIDKKLDKALDKYMKSIDIDNRDANVLIAKGVRWGFTVKFDMDLPGGFHIHANEKRKELRFAISAVSTEVKRQLRKYKEKNN